MSGKQKFTSQEVVDACKDSGGVMAVVAQVLGCERATISVYAKRYKTVRDALEQADEAMTDMAENKHALLIKSSYWPAIQYRLSTKGKRRGYTERTEITGAEGAPVELVVRYENPPKVEDGEHGQ